MKTFLFILLSFVSYEVSAACYTSVPANEQSIDASRTEADGVTNTYYINNFGALVLYQKSEAVTTRLELTLKLAGDCNLSQIEAIHTADGYEEALALDQKGVVQYYGWRSGKGWSLTAAKVTDETLPKFIQLQKLMATKTGFALKVIYQDTRKQREGMLSFNYATEKWSFSGR